MNKIGLLVPISAMFALSLAGCGNNQKDNAQDRYTDSAQPIGYYSNEDHHGGNARMLEDNDGALTEMMDHTMGNEGRNLQSRETKKLQTKDENGNPANPTVPYAQKNENFFVKDNRFQDSDRNYHGHLNNAGYKPETNMYNQDLSKRIEKSAERIENVEDVHAIVYGDSVLIAAKLNNPQNASQVKSTLAQEMKALTEGRKLKVVTDDASYNSLKGMLKSFNGQRMTSKSEAELRNMFNEDENNLRN